MKIKRLVAAAVICSMLLPMSGCSKKEETAQAGTLDSAEETVVELENVSSDNTAEGEVETAIGEFEYYDFSVSGSSSTSTDVLVCVNGIDVVSGVQNEDGSWSFDQ